jgi:hypothetical protein
MKFTAKWDAKFGQREPDCIFLMAGEQCLGYIHRSKKSLMACVGAGLGAPIVAGGVLTLDECKRAVEAAYQPSSSTSEGIT